MAFAAGVNTSLSASMSAFVITWFAVTSVPSSSRSPALSTAVIFTLASVPPSLSEKLKSEAENVYAVSSVAVTVLFDAVGTVLLVVSCLPFMRSTRAVPDKVSAQFPPDWFRHL